MIRLLQSIVLLYFILSSSLLLAEPYHSDSDNNRQLTIRSLYKYPDVSTWGHEKYWYFRFTELMQGHVFLAEQEEPILSLNYDSQQRLIAVTDVQYKVHNRSLVPGDNSVILSHGHPVPYDDLHALLITKSKEVVDRRTIAGVVFKKTFKADFREVTKAAVRLPGYIFSGLDDQVISSQLYWLELYRDDQLVIRQLWDPSLSWWLYEETLERKSWLEKIN